MDEAAIEKAGLAPIAADLSRIQSARDTKDIATLFGTPGMPSVFKIFATPDAKQPDKYSLEIGQSGLGLPNRDYYLQDDAKLKEVRAQYLAYIEQMLTLGGVNEAAAKAKDIMAFETSLARVYWPIERLRDADATYNPYAQGAIAFLCAGASIGRRTFRPRKFRRARTSCWGPTDRHSRCRPTRPSTLRWIR